MGYWWALCRSGHPVQRRGDEWRWALRAGGLVRKQVQTSGLLCHPAPLRLRSSSAAANSTTAASPPPLARAAHPAAAGLFSTRLPPLRPQRVRCRSERDPLPFGVTATGRRSVVPKSVHLSHPAVASMLPPYEGGVRRR